MCRTRYPIVIFVTGGVRRSSRRLSSLSYLPVGWGASPRWSVPVTGTAPYGGRRDRAAGVGGLDSGAKRAAHASRSDCDGGIGSGGEMGGSAGGDAAVRRAHTITVDSGHAGRRLDKFLRARFKGVPAGLLFRHIRQGRLRVNGRKTAQNYRLVEGDEITVPELRIDDRGAGAHRVPAALLDRMRRTVLYEDARLLVVDKPAGVAVHRGSDVPAGAVEAMRALRPDAPDLELVHRLDRDTSGTLALAKDPALLRELHALLRERADAIERHYLAVVAGRFPAGLETLDAPLRRTEAAVMVDPRGDWAETAVAIERRLG